MSSIMAFSFLACFDSSFLLFPMPCALNFFCPHFLSSQQQRNHNLSSVRPTVKKKEKKLQIFIFCPKITSFSWPAQILYFFLYYFMLHFHQQIKSLPYLALQIHLSVLGREREREGGKKSATTIVLWNCCNITSCTCFWFGCIRCIQTLTQVLKPNYVAC